MSTLAMWRRIDTSSSPKSRIAAISDSAPAGVPVVDLSRYTVVPGLIDCHAHVLGDTKDQSSTSGLRMSSAQKAIWECATCKSGLIMDLPHYARLAKTILRMRNWPSGTVSRQG